MTLYSVSTISVHVSHAHEWAFTHVYTHTEPHVGGQRSSGPPPQPCCMCSLCSSTPFPPDRCSCSAPSGSGSGRHKGCLCYKPSASQTVYGTLGLTCPPVQMLMNWDIVLIFFCFSVLHFLLHVFLKKQLEDYFLCPSFSWFPLCVKRCWRCNFNYSSFL